MKHSYSDLFLEILSVLNYRDKENFVKNFEQMNHLEAMTNCIERLPQKEREEIIRYKTDPQIIHKYVDKDEYTEELTAVSTKAMSDFLQHITPALTNDQKEKISYLFN